MDDHNSLGDLGGRPYADLVRLLERDEELAAIRSVVDRIGRGGQGAGFAITGESGSGKTALLEAVCEDLVEVRVLRGHCDPLLTPRPLGPFRDLGVAELDGSGDDDALLSDVCEQVYAALREEPTVLVLEDLHWVDAASVEVLRFLARRVESMPLVLLMTYRDLEIDPRHSARRLLGDIARLEGFETLAVRPLSVQAVEQVLRGTGLDASRVHTVTGGNAFFVTEVAKEPGLPMPMSVRTRCWLAPQQSRRTTSRCSSSSPRHRSGWTTASFPPWVSTFRRSVVSTRPRCSAAPQAASCSVMSWPGRPSRALSRPAVARGCTPRCWTRSSASV